MPGPEVLRPGHSGYEAARRVWTAMVGRRPPLIVRCRTAADVATAIGIARREGLEVGVRGGGGGALLGAAATSSWCVTPDSQVDRVDVAAALATPDYTLLP